MKLRQASNDLGSLVTIFLKGYEIEKLHASLVHCEWTAAPRALPNITHRHTHHISSRLAMKLVLVLVVSRYLSRIFTVHVTYLCRKLSSSEIKCNDPC